MTLAPEAEQKRFAPQSPTQLRVFSSAAPTIALSGSIGTGKSRIFLEGMDRACRLWPGNAVLVGRKKATDAFSSLQPIYDRYVRTPDLIPLYRKSEAGGATQWYPNGSRLVWFGADNPGKVLSAEYGGGYVDQAEELDEDEANAIEGRLRLNVPPARLLEDELQGLPRAWRALAYRADEPGVWLLPLIRQMGYAFNPDSEQNWGNRRFGFKGMQDRGELRTIQRSTEPIHLDSGEVVPPGEPLADVIIANPADNAHNLDRTYHIRKASKTGPWRDRFVLGLWGTFEGQLLPNFRESAHVIARPDNWDGWGGYPPPTWPRFRAIDFGYAPGHPFVMQWWARKPRAGEAPPIDFLYQEIYMTGRVVSVHAAQAKAWDAEEVAALNRGIERWNREHPTQPMARRERLSFSGQWADHDAEDRATLEMCNIVVDPAIKERQPRPQLIAERLEQGRLFFVRTARRELDPECKRSGRPTCTWEEMSGLRWLKPPTSDEKGPKEDWAKVNDDGFDATGYFLLSERERGPMDLITL